MMKKWWLVALSLVMVFVLAACGGSGGSQQSSGGGGAGSSPSSSDGQQTSAPQQSKRYDLSFGTSTTGGTGYMYAVAVSMMVNHYAEGNIKITPFPTAGVIENDRLLREGNADLILHTAEYAYYSYKGEKNFDSPYELRALWPPYASLLNIVVPADSDIHSIKDLKGKRIGMGEPGSSANVTMTQLLEVNGITKNDITEMALNLNEQVDALKDGTIDAITTVIGRSAPALMDLANSRDVRWLSVDEESFAKMEEILPPGAIVKVILPANTYKNQTEDVTAIGVPLWVVTDEKLEGHVAEQIISSFFQNLEEAKKIHPTVSETTPELINNAVPPIPWHPAAEGALKSVGYNPVPYTP